MFPASVVIDDLNIYRTGRSFRPLKAYSPLVVDANAVLAFAIASQGLKAVAWQGRKVLERGRRFQTVKLQPGGPLNAGKDFDPFAGREVQAPPIPIG